MAATTGPTITLAVGALCLVFGLAVFWRGNPEETAAGFWPPAGVSLAAMLVLPVRRWGWVIAGTMVPTVLGVALDLAPAEPASWWLLGNCVEPAVAALILLAFESSRWITRGRLLLVFLVVAVVGAPMIGGAIGSIGSVVGYDRPWTEAWVEWIVADGLGVLVVVPLLVTYTTRGLVRRTRGEMVAPSVLVVTVAALTFADFGSDGESLVPYLILAPLIWVGMRFGTASLPRLVSSSASVRTWRRRWVAARSPSPTGQPTW